MGAMKQIYTDAMLDAEHLCRHGCSKQVREKLILELAESYLLDELHARKCEHDSEKGKTERIFKHG